MIFKTDKDRVNAYRNTFSTLEDTRVMVDILGTLGFWETTTREGLTPVEQNVLNLYAKKILMRCAGEKFGTIVSRALMPRVLVPNTVKRKRIRVKGNEND